jgi:hypothetical protein
MAQVADMGDTQGKAHVGAMKKNSNAAQHGRGCGVL